MIEASYPCSDSTLDLDKVVFFFKLYGIVLCQEDIKKQKMDRRVFHFSWS